MTGPDFALSEGAQGQWETFHATFLNRGAAIKFVDPNLGFPTQPLRQTLRPARWIGFARAFRHPEYPREEPVLTAAFRMLQTHAHISSVAEPPENLRGAGDFIRDEQSNLFWSDS